MEIPLIIFAAKGLKGAFAIHRLVDGRSGEADIGGLGQSGHEKGTEITAGGAVGFIN